MADGADAMHPLVRDLGERAGVRFSMRVGEPESLGLVLLANTEERVGIVLAVLDDDGDRAAVGLTHTQAAELHAALGAALADEGAWGL